MNILVINAGSSSLKYQLMDPNTGAVSAKGLCERIGIDGKFTYKAGGKTVIDAVAVAMPTHSEAIAAVLATLVNPEYGVGGRLHGGDRRCRSPRAARRYGLLRVLPGGRGLQGSHP